MEPLQKIKRILAEENHNPTTAKPLAPRGVGSFSSQVHALTTEQAESLAGIWYAQVGDLLLPTYDARGEVIGARLWTTESKRLAPSSASGLATTAAILADSAALDWLRGGSLDTLYIAEGEPDWASLAVLSRWLRSEGVAAGAAGIYSGAWRGDFGDACDRVKRVIICTDNDKAGDRYAGEIRASITGEVKVYRWLGWRREDGTAGDVNDAVKFGFLGPDLLDLLAQDMPMPQPPTADAGRWEWATPTGWAECGSWLAAREAEKAWAAARSLPRESLGDEMLERARKWCDAKLTAVCTELEGIDGDRARALSIMAPVMSLVAGGALDGGRVEAELVSAYVEGDKETRRDRLAQIKGALKSGPGGRPREAITLEDVAAKLAVEDAEKKAQKTKAQEARGVVVAIDQNGSKNKPQAKTAAPVEGMTVSDWHSHVDALGWDRSPSEVELANRLLDYLTPPGMPAPVSAEGALWRYSPSKGVWVEVSESTVAVVVSRWDGAESADGKGVRINERSLKGARNIAMSLVEDPGFFGGAPRGVMLADRFVSIDPIKRTYTEQRPGPEHRARHRVEAKPSEPSALLRHYLATAHDGDDAADKVRLMGEVAFAALTGTGTAYKKAVLCYGGKGSGKSQYLHLVQSLVPASAKVSIMPQDMGHDYHCAALAGKTLNLVGELEADEFMKEGKFKSIVHGEAVQARNPNERVFQLWPIALHLFNANNLPAAPGVSPAFWDRWIIVGFDRGWTDDDRALVEGGIDEIGKQITDTDMGGFLSWVLECGRALVERGRYTIPETSRRLMKEWQAEGDSVSGWLEDCCVLLAKEARQDQWEKATGAYKDYEMYCSSNNFRPVNSRKFKNRLSACGVRHARAASGFLYCLRLAARF